MVIIKVNFNNLLFAGILFFFCYTFVLLLKVRRLCEAGYSSAINYF